MGPSDASATLSRRRQAAQPRGQLTSLLLALALLMGGVATITAQESEPARVDQMVTAGPWEMRLLEAQTGDDAAATVAGASEFNAASPGDGLQFVAARLSVLNVSSASHGIQPDDFAVIGSDGIVRRSEIAFLPNPALAGRIAVGEQAEGWVVGVAPAGDEDIVLRYDSASISGTWADADFAVTEGARLPETDGRAERTNKVGRDGDAVGIDEVVATGDWAVSLQEVVVGPAVYDIAPPGTQRLADSYRAGTSAICMETWVALRFRIANNGDDGRARFLSQTAFRFADEEGRPIEDVRSLSAPAPEAAGEYLPGAQRSGWISFEIPSLCDGDAINLLTDSTVVRFLPFSDSRDARYFDFSGDGSPPADEPPPVANLTEGDRATVSEDVVNLRGAPSTEADIVAELTLGEAVVVTGPSEEGDGVTWYPVEVEATGETGYVSGAYLEAA
jgi:hypothetical protein